VHAELLDPPVRLDELEPRPAGLEPQRQDQGERRGDQRDGQRRPLDQLVRALGQQRDQHGAECRCRDEGGQHVCAFRSHSALGGFSP
jgi:hypothetical protein